jgi:hypothetical protein
LINPLFVSILFLEQYFHTNYEKVINERKKLIILWKNYSCTPITLKIGKTQERVVELSADPFHFLMLHFVLFIA